jgi:predicted DNA-binding transcriptional regulator AlpA
LDADLISKKEVLELTGISYGQLYRWKRKNIIPEDWFIKKSSFTGQETFFPREKMLARIEKVKELKDTHSLDELTDFFSPNPTKVEITLDSLRLQKILHSETISLCTPLLKNVKAIEFPEILNMFILEKVRTRLICEEDQKTLFRFLQENFAVFNSPSYELRGLRKKDIVIWILLPLHTNPYIDRTAETIVKLDLLQMFEELKITLKSEINY